MIYLMTPPVPETKKMWTTDLMCYVPLYLLSQFPTSTSSQFTFFILYSDIAPSRMRDIDLGDSYKGKVVSRKKMKWKPTNPLDDDSMSDDTGIDDQDDTANAPLRTIPTFESEDEEEDLTFPKFKDISVSTKPLKHSIKEPRMQPDGKFDTLFEDFTEKKGGIAPEFRTKKGEKPNPGDWFKQSYVGYPKKSEQDNQFNEYSTSMTKQMTKADELQKEVEAKEKAAKLKIKIDPRTQSFQLRKANAVRAQTKLYDKMATLRIHLQKVHVILFSVFFVFSDLTSHRITDFKLR